MALITLDVPKEKAKIFLLMLMQLGFDDTTESISPTANNQSNGKQLYAVSASHIPQQQHPYFNWDFYNSELEFE
jgi:hypothetical protein